MKKVPFVKYFFFFVICDFTSKVWSLKALDFSLDSDGNPDENNIYTHSSLQIENLPPSFTICTAFMVEAWAEYTDAKLFVLLGDNGEVWNWVKISAFETYTEFSFRWADSPEFSARSEILFYPLQWTRVCLSKDNDTSLTRLVVDCELLVESELKVKNQPENLDLALGSLASISGYTYEDAGQTTNLNIFSFALTVEQMKLHTSPAEEKCGLQGDFLSWKKSVEEEQWTLHSQARWVDLDDGLEGPCRATADLNVFPMSMNKKYWQSECMNHCKKLGGRSPSVKTKTGWENLLREVKALSPDPSKLPGYIWLSATEGDIGGELERLDHWPEDVEAQEGVWRDFYTGEQLENYTKPWMETNEDKVVGDTYNCLLFYPTMPETRTWYEWECYDSSLGCPCTYESHPLIRLRGFCPDTDLEHKRYTVTQSATDPSNIMLVGFQSARIAYNSSLSQWMYSDPRLNLTAISRASRKSYALGKHNWTILGD